MAEDSQWKMRIAFEADKSGLDKSVAGVKQLTGATEAQTKALERYNAAAAQALATQEELTVGARTMATTVAGLLKQLGAIPDTSSRSNDFTAAEAKWARQLELTKALQSVRQSMAAQSAASDAAELARRKDVVAQQQKYFDLLKERHAVEVEQQRIATAALAENAAGVEKSRTSMVGYSQAINRTGSLLGGLSSLGRAFLNPMALGLLVGIELLQKYNSYLEKIQKVKELSVVGESEYNDTLERQRDLLDKLALSTEQYRRQLERTMNRPENAETVLGRRLQLEQQANKAAMDLIDVRYNHEKSQLEALYAAGLLSYAEFNRRKDQIDVDHAKAKAEQEKAKLDADYKRAVDQRDAAGRTIDNTRAMGGPLDRAEGAQAAAALKVEALKKQVDTVQKEVEDSRKGSGDHPGLEELNKKVLERQDELRNRYDLKAEEMRADLWKKIAAAPGANAEAKAQAGRVQDAYDQYVAEVFANDPILKILLQKQEQRAKQLDDEMKILERHKQALAEATDEENKAKEAVDALKKQLDDLATAFREATTKIKTMDATMPGQKAAIDAQVDAMVKGIQDAAAADEFKRETAAGVGVGSSGSQLRWLAPAKAAQWLAMDAVRRRNAPVPGFEFDPNKVDPRTGQPVDPTQGRRLNPWEPGAQGQFDADRWRNAPVDENAAVGKINELVRQRQQAEQALEKYHGTNMEVVSNLQQQIERMSQDIARLAKEHNSRINDASLH